MAVKLETVSGRQIEFDAARGAAMIGVVFSHNCGLGHFYSFIVPYYVALFFLIAGYFSSADSSRCKKRIAMLVKEYFKYTAILFVLSFILPPPTGTVTWYQKLLGSLYARYLLYYPVNGYSHSDFMLMDNEALWFLPAMAVATALFSFLVKKAVTVFHKLLCVCGLILISYLFTFCPILLPWSIDTASIFCLFLLLGYWCRQSGILGRYYHQRWQLLYFFVAIALYCILKILNPKINISIRQYEYGGSHLYNVIFYTAIGVLGTFLCIITCRLLCLCPLGRILALIGRHTLTIMGLHIMLWTKVKYLEFIFPGLFASQIVAVLTNIAIIFICILLDILAGRLRGCIRTFANSNS